MTATNNRLTRIVATVGPASNSRQAINDLIDAGVDIFRLNFSHGDHDTHAEVINFIRSVATEKEIQVAILQDLGGPKLRIGTLTDNMIHLSSGDTFVLEKELELGDESKVGLPDTDSWYDEVHEGERVVLGDGIITLRIHEKTDDHLTCEVQSGGTLRSRAGLHFPDSAISLGAMTAKDWIDLAFGLDQRVDAIALSFVQDADDVIAVRRYVESGKHRPLLISKMERRTAIDQRDAILKVSDGIMVARGDLGISMPIEQVPTIQKDLIYRARKQAKFVITATQMLESMTDAPIPTRAEVTDVANAVYDGTDAVMLSGETAIGADPVRVVKTMAQILVEAETHASFSRQDAMDDSVEEAIALSARILVEQVNARMMIAPLTSGSTAARLSRHLPKVPILAGVSTDEYARSLKFRHAVLPIRVPRCDSLLENLTFIVDRATRLGGLSEGETIVVAGGFPINQPGVTNFLRVVTVGKPL